MLIDAIGCVLSWNISHESIKIEQYLLSILIELAHFTNVCLEKKFNVNKLSLLKSTLLLYNLPSNFKRFEILCQILRISVILRLSRT